MPLYTFVKDDEDPIEISCSMKEYDQVKKDMEEQGYRRSLQPITVVDGVRDIYATSDGGWKDTLHRIKSGSGRGNTIYIP